MFRKPMLSQINTGGGCDSDSRELERCAAATFPEEEHALPPVTGERRLPSREPDT
jgi:hypothetical protein